MSRILMGCPPHSRTLGEATAMLWAALWRDPGGRDLRGFWATASEELNPRACEDLNPARPPGGPERGSFPSETLDERQPSLTAGERLSQRYPGKPRLDSQPKECDTVNACCFMGLYLGIICWTAQRTSVPAPVSGPATLQGPSSPGFQLNLCSEAWLCLSN